MSNWREVTLTELGSVERGRSRHRPRNDPILFGGETPFFQTGDVKAATLHLTSPTQYYSDTGVEQSRVWQPGITCITIAANIAETAVLGREGCFPDSVLGFSPFIKEDAYFVKYLLDVHRTELAAAARGTTQDNLSLEKLLAHRFAAPDVDTRRRIAQVLRTLDEIIEVGSSRVRILRDMALTLYGEWFCRFRYPGNSEDGGNALSLPPGWDVRPLHRDGPFCLDKPRIEPYPGSRTYLATANCVGFHNLSEGLPLQFTELPSRAQLQPAPETVFFGRMAGYQKVVAMPTGSPEADEYVLSSGFACIRCDPGWFSFVLSSVLSDGFETTKSQYATGATQVSLTDAGALRIPWLIPASEVVMRYEDIARPMFLEALNLARLNRVTTRLRDLLLPRLVSGTIDVSHLDLDALTETEIT